MKETLNRIADELFKQQCPDEPGLIRPQLMAEAIIELCRRGTANGNTGRIPQADITLIVNADDLSTAFTPDEQTTDGSSLKPACCDAIITTVTIDDRGQPLNVRRARRLAAHAQRRAAMDSPTPTAGTCNQPAHPENSLGPPQPEKPSTPNTTHRYWTR